MLLTGDSEVIAEEGSAEGADDAGEDEVAGDLALVELRPPGARRAAGEPASHLSHPPALPLPPPLLVTQEGSSSLLSSLKETKKQER